MTIHGYELTELLKGFQNNKKYSFQKKKSWFRTKYTIVYEDYVVAHVGNKKDAKWIVELLNCVSLNFFMEGTMKMSEYIKPNSVDFLKWVVSSECDYRCNENNLWEYGSESITSEQLYEKFKNTK